MPNQTLSVYQKLARLPAGKWLFSRLVCFKAPYFASIAPRVVRLQPGHGEATLRHRRRVTNHIGTVHAIALCNLAEFIGGLTTDVSVPAAMRWIPKGMQVEYLKKATGPLRATATPAFDPPTTPEAYTLPMRVEVINSADDIVFRASIDMWISPRTGRPG